MCLQFLWLLRECRTVGGDALLEHGMHRPYCVKGATFVQPAQKPTLRTFAQRVHWMRSVFRTAPSLCVFFLIVSKAVVLLTCCGGGSVDTVTCMILRKLLPTWFGRTHDVLGRQVLSGSGTFGWHVDVACDLLMARAFFFNTRGCACVCQSVLT